MDSATPTFAAEAEATLQLAARYARVWQAGDVVYFEGDLGAGKTTFIRGVLKELGHIGAVRSPTFNLLQTFDTEPPVLHADLYRLANAAGTGLEDYLSTHLLLIEWPDRMYDMVAPADAWKVQIQFADPGRLISVTPPSRANQA